MTNLTQKKKGLDIQMNIEDVKLISVPESVFLDIEKTFDFIDAHLPRNYTRQVVQLFESIADVDTSYIRKVKKERILNVRIISALYRIAQFSALQKNNQTN